jgi:hypothetical protein
VSSKEDEICMITKEKKGLLHVDMGGGKVNFKRKDIADYISCMDLCIK